MDTPYGTYAGEVSFRAASRIGSIAKLRTHPDRASPAESGGALVHVTPPLGCSA